VRSSGIEKNAPKAGAGRFTHTRLPATAIIPALNQTACVVLTEQRSNKPVRNRAMLSLNGSMQLQKEHDREPARAK
jgi:hypothetical protein